MSQSRRQSGSSYSCDHNNRSGITGERALQSEAGAHERLRGTHVAAAATMRCRAVLKVLEADLLVEVIPANSHQPGGVGVRYAARWNGYGRQMRCPLVRREA